MQVYLSFWFLVMNGGLKRGEGKYKKRCVFAAKWQ